MVRAGWLDAPVTGLVSLARHHAAWMLTPERFSMPLN
jgi:hypothetical protein